MRKFLAVFILPFVFICSNSSAAAVLTAGEHEIGFGAEFTSSSDLKNTNINIDWGYYFTAENQGSLLIDYNKMEVGGVSMTGGFFGLVYDRNLPGFKKDKVPYFGGGFKIPLSDYKDVYDNVIFIHGGMKFFLSSMTAVRLSLDLERYAGADTFDDSTSIALRAGYVVKFDRLGFSKRGSDKNVSGKKKPSKKKTSRRRRRK